MADMLALALVLGALMAVCLVGAAFGSDSRDLGLDPGRPRRPDCWW